MIMSRVCRDGESCVFVAGNDRPVAHFPWRNFESGNAKRSQIRPHIIWHNAEVLTDHARGPGFFQHNAQVFVALAHVRHAVFQSVVVTGNEMRGATTSLPQHLVLIEWEKFLVFLWAPRKSIDAIKTLDVIDSKKMEDAPDSAYPLAPPLKIVRSHGAPAIERNTPVLPPFLRERVVFEVRFGRGANEPVENEFVGARENVGAAITDAERNIAH